MLLPCADEVLSSMFSDLEVTTILALLHYFLLNSPRSEFRALTKDHGLDDLDQIRAWLLAAFPKIRDGSTIKLDELVAVHTVTKVILGNWPPETLDAIWETENRIASPGELRDVLAGVVTRLGPIINQAWATEQARRDSKGV
jgi:hypothetical protein